MRWAFDPPLALPQRGEYVFWVQDEGCNALDYPVLYHGGGDDYPYGTPWYTMRDLTGRCQVPNVLGGGSETADMCFELVFCRTPSSQAMSSSSAGGK